MAESEQFSPCKSPAQGKEFKKPSQHSVTGHLRKLKDMAADVHNTLEKWESFNAKGSSILSDIVNTRLEYIYQQSSEEGEEGGDKNKSDIVSLSSKLDPKCDALHQVCQSMEGAVTKLASLASTARGLHSLCQHRDEADDILGVTWTIHNFVEAFKALHSMYAKELHLKTEIAKTVALAETRESLMFYSAAWMHQPYIDSQMMVKAVLMETGHQPVT
ncbi:cyclin-dependent kinase 2-interacting protein-like [Littorina saxatilis]|uniref:Cyclin-dependent kinase 2-interacting protein n=1 Tax=Littorina saxatilis TaxID=31220 RepID=A0AAN9GCY1_9CAEN